MKPQDDPEFMQFMEECILDLNPAHLNICEIIQKSLGSIRSLKHSNSFPEKLSQNA
jgi:hypothetical protein